jgi:hypothetical protein
MKGRHVMKTLGLNLPNEDIDFDDSSDESTSIYLERDREKKREGVDKELERYISDFEDSAIDCELYKLEECGKHKIPVTNKNGNRRLITVYCKKPYCPRCGAKNGLRHKSNFRNVIRQLGNLENEFIRQFVFTLPHHLLPKFESKHMLNKFIELVKRVIEKEFGLLIREKRTKRGIKRKYRLQRKVLCSIELFGEQHTYHPHVNVLIFETENKKNRKDISPEQLIRIKRSYKYALEKLLSEKIEVVDVHYSYHSGKKKIK